MKVKFSMNRVKSQLVAGVAVLLMLAIGCGKYDGSVKTNQLPEVDFANTPSDSSSFNYAPVISWFGRDADGFVEFYSYADIMDPAAIANPAAYRSQIPSDAWKTTPATRDTIVLLTTSGDTTRHVFYLKATDNRGGESSIKWRTFDRTNKPPDPPTFRDANDNWTSRLVIADTLFSIESTNDLWTGITFNWTGHDSDSRIGREIPLTFKYYVIKSPSDTIRRFVAQEWVSTKTLTLSGLESGSYRLEVYARDDGWTVSRTPGVVYFAVQRPTFDRSILIYMEGVDDRTSYGATVTMANAKAYYRDLLRSVQYTRPFLSYQLPDTLGNGDTTDVTFYTHTGARSDSIPPIALLSRYRVVLWMQDVVAPASRDGNFIERRLERIGSYLQVGGRVLVAGRYFNDKVFPSSPANNLAARTNFTRTYLGTEIVNDTELGTTYSSTQATVNSDFIATVPAFGSLIRMDFDTTRYRPPHVLNALGSLRQINGLPGPYYMQIFGETRSLFSWFSNSDTINPHVIGEDSEVIQVDPVTINGQRITYPPTPTNCLIKIRKSGLLDSIISVVNVTKRNANPNSNYRGEVRSVTGQFSFISYEYGEPWVNADVLEVEYYYRATSPRHLLPVGSAYEVTQIVPNTSISALLTRNIMLSTPLYFYNQTQVASNFAKMLDWLLGPPNYELR